jgi:hypothetical protein
MEEVATETLELLARFYDRSDTGRAGASPTELP